MASRDFLIVDFSIASRDEDGRPTLRRVALEDLWEELDKAREDSAVKIAVYEIGDCVLDWS